MSGVRYICGGADHPHRHLILCKRQYNCGDADLSQRHFLCKRQYKRGNTDLSQRHLLCKRQYNCGDTDLSQRHLLCKRQYNCGNTDLSQRHLLCKRQNNCGDTDLSQRHLLCKHQYNSDDQPAAATAATIRATAPSGSSAYCACHTKARRLQEALCTAPATQKRAAATAATIRATAPSGSYVYCTCQPKASRGHSGDYPRRSFRKLCVLRLPHKSPPRPRRRLSAPQLLQEALRTAPATQKRAAATAATIRAAAPSGSSVYCACHAKASRGHGGDYPRRSSFRKLCVLRLPRKSEPRPRRRLSAPHLLQAALRTAPATQKRAAATAATIRAAAPSGSSAYCACHAKARRGHGGDYPRHSSFRAMCTAPANQKRAAATAATIRAAAPSGSSAYCACHTKARRGHGGDYPRHSSFRKLCVLCLPRKSESRPRRRLSAPQLLQEALCTVPATQKRVAATAATIRATPSSSSSAYCACHAKASRGHGGDYPRRSSFRKLCVLRLPRKSAPRPRRRLSAPHLLQAALCTEPATQKRAAATAATIRATPSSGSSAYCACHAKARRGHGGDYPRHTFFRQLCVLSLPRKSEPRPRRRLSAPQLLQEALRTAPATQKRVAATAATIRATPSSGSSAYCACHAKASRGHGGDYPRRSSFRKLCVLRLPRKSEPRPRRRLSAPQLLQEALCTAPANPRRSSFKRLRVLRLSVR